MSVICPVCGETWLMREDEICCFCREYPRFPDIRQAQRYGRARGWAAFDIVIKDGRYEAVERKGAGTYDTE